MEWIFYLRSHILMKKMFGIWWNSESIGDFWRNWNLPVHDFTKELIYDPLINRMICKSTAVFVCFLFSGFVHDYVVSITLRFYNGRFLCGMLVQISLYHFTIVVKELAPSFVNTFFQLCICVVERTTNIGDVLDL